LLFQDEDVGVGVGIFLEREEVLYAGGQRLYKSMKAGNLPLPEKCSCR